MSRLVVRALPVVAVAVLLGACSSMPEWTKPTTWIDGVTDKKAQKADAKPAEQKETTQTASPAASDVVDPLAPAKKPALTTASDKPTEFPNLSAQPAARQATTTDPQRREIRDSLVADRDHAQHSADELRGGQTPAAPPPAPASATDKKPADPAAPADQPKSP